MVRERESAETWRRRVEEWKSSGIALDEFIKQSGLKPRTFRWWIAELRRRDRESKREAPTFVPVTVATRAPAPAMELVLRNGHVLRVPADFDPASLRRLIAAVGGREE
jgi:transposase